MLKRKQRHGFASFGDVKISVLEGTIISAFFPEGEERTIKEIQERVEYSYERVNSALKSLAKKGIVIEAQKGKTLVYSLVLKNIYAESMGFNAYMLQRETEFIKKHKAIYRAVKKIAESQYILGVIIFGSYSKETETRRSDVDIVCISYKRKETEQFIRSLKFEFDVVFSPVIMALDEFPNIKKENPELWNDLKKYGIVFKGEDMFYYWMYKDEKN